MPTASVGWPSALRKGRGRQGSASSRSVGMSGSERLDSKCGPFANVWLTYSNALDAMAKSYEPVALGVGRYQLELMTLALRRTQAWLARPTELTRCRTPQDAIAEQLE